MLLLNFHAHKKTRKCYEVKGCTLLFRVKVVDFDVPEIRLIDQNDLVSTSFS